MKRTTITMDGNGILSIPSNLEYLSCNSTEGRMPFVENGRIFDASVVHCRIDLVTH